MECKKCSKFQDFKNFYFDKRYKSYSKTCNACKAMIKKEKYYKNLEKSRANNNSYRQKNKEKYNNYMREYKKKNPDKVRSTNKKWYHESGGKERKKEKDKINRPYLRMKEKERYHSNIETRLRKIYRARLSKVMKGLRKEENTYSLLGCDMEYFKKWIESQFSEDMNWDNYGVLWVIDHVVPCNYFCLSNLADQKTCFSWKNLRPCLSSENSEKSDKIIETLISEHYKLAQEYETLNPVPSNSGNIVVAQNSDLRYGNNPANDEIEELCQSFIDGSISEMGERAAKS